MHDIKCCPDRGDLCHRREVEKNSEGKIAVWTSSDEYVDVDVSTTAKRQHYCRQKNNRDGVYCRNDPDGDALSGRPYNCNDHYCTAGDCASHFERSSAYDTRRGADGDTDPTYTISATDGSSQSCTVTASCKNAVVSYGGETTYTDIYATKTHTDEVWNLPELKNCKYMNNLTTGDCPRDEWTE